MHSRRISIHAPTRGATLHKTTFCPSPEQFQSTLPRGERQRSNTLSPGYEPFQSTLPRGERPTTLPISPFHFIISIHAPTRGATLSHKKDLIYLNFNPRSHEGSDIYGLKEYSYDLYHFNPRSHEGSDHSMRL